MSQNFIQFSSQEENPYFEGVYDISPSEVKDCIASQASTSQPPTVKLIDVRQPDEYVGELGHVKEAELIVLDTLPQSLQQLPKDQTIVVICRSGNRSANATAFLHANGFTSVYNMKGGMILWNELGLPVER